MSLPIITIIISIVGGAFFYKIKRTLWNPASVFLFEWALVIYLASLQLYNLIDISTEAFCANWSYSFFCRLFVWR